MTVNDLRSLMTGAESGIALLALMGVLGLGLGYAITSRWPIPQQKPMLLTIQPRYILPVILLIAVFLRLIKIDEHLWYDETFTYVYSRIWHQAPEFSMAAMLGDVHPPLWYWITGFFIDITGSASIFVLRLPSLLAGLWLVYLFYRLGTTLFDKGVGVTAAALVAVMPQAIYYSVEARGYALLACLVIVGMLAIIENTPGRFLLLVPAAFIHNIGLVQVAALVLPALLIHRRNPHWRFVILITCILSCLWLPAALLQSRDIADGFWLWPPGPLGGLFYLIETTISQRLVPDQPVLIIVTYVLFFTISAAALLDSLRWPARSRNLLLWAYFFVPVFLMVVSWLFLPVWLMRAVLANGLLLLIPFSVMMLRDKRLAVFASLPVALAVFLFFSHSSRPDVQPVIEPCKDVETIYNSGLPAHFMTTYYLPGRPQFLWQGANDVNQTLPAAAKSAIGFVDASGPMPGNNCIYFVKTPHTQQAEIRHIAAITGGREPDYAFQMSEINDTFIWIIDVN